MAVNRNLEPNTNGAITATATSVVNSKHRITQNKELKTFIGIA
jgi:hypothetical protein